MAGDSTKDIKKAAADKLKLWIVLLNRSITERNPREKQLIIVLGLIGIAFFDYWILINPVVKTYVRVSSQYVPLETELKGLRADRKNQKLIEKKWNEAKADLENAEKCFIALDEMPSFLENISKLAQDSGVQVTALQPLERTEKAGNSKKKGTLNSSPYPAVLIRLNASGGTHEIGKFLSCLENSATCIKIKDVKISAHAMDDHRHGLELEVAVYRLEARR
ncbi:MAG: hypothetical protein AUJ71_04165 [Candidatus Omnitrophica bacterium CG1_02_49_16]|nr:MAG: hypothetical protein AUJ71_04165 [Candidatus Omnitrophica bacterium CG1_02_49_16]